MTARIRLLKALFAGVFGTGKNVDKMLELLSEPDPPAVKLGSDVGHGDLVRCHCGRSDDAHKIVGHVYKCLGCTDHFAVL